MVSKEVLVRFLSGSGVCDVVRCGALCRSKDSAHGGRLLLLSTRQDR